MGRVNAEVQLNLPPGFRFFPTDEELLVHYLCRKAASQTLAVPIIAEVDLYKFDPWQLPDKALFGEKEWYFFTPRDRKYPNGSRPNRAAGSGYWKATGADKPITAKNSGKRVGIKKALVFYVGKAPKGTKTNWIMHEYRLADANRTTANKKKGSLRLDDWVLCRIYNKKSSAEKLAKEHKEWSQDETMGQVHPHDEMDERETQEIHHGGAASGHGLIEHSERTSQDSDKSSPSPDCTTASVHDSRISAVASMSCNPGPFFQHRMNPSNGGYPQIELTELAPLFSSMNNNTTTTTTATTRAAYDAGEPAPPLLMTDSSCSMQSSPDIKTEKEEVQSRPKMPEFFLAQLQQQDNVALNQPFYNFGFESLPNPFSQLDHMQAHSANPTDPLQDYFTSLSAPGLHRTY